MPPRVFATLLALAILPACGNTAGPGTGTVFFNLDAALCAGYTSATYLVDSTEVGTEAFVPGTNSNAYTVTSGAHITVARLTKPAVAASLWTFRDRITVPSSGSVTAHLSC